MEHKKPYRQQAFCYSLVLIL